MTTSKEIERATLEILRRDVFECLPARPEVDAIADLGVSCDGSDLRIREVRHEIAYGIVRDDAVGIDADVDLFVDVFEREVECIGLAAVGLGQDGEAT